MTLQFLSEKLTNMLANDEENTILPSYALHPEIAGTPYYDAPLFGCAAADDPLFATFKADPKIYGPILQLPNEWLGGAKSVISIFFPFSTEVRESNIENLNIPSPQWLHGRIEGQDFLMKACDYVADLLRKEGYQAVVPAGHPDFREDRDPERQEKGIPPYVSNWSERHCAFIAGLGTFSLSRHLITEKGVCGRLGSIITDAVIEPTPRAYTDAFEYCIFCGKCAERCPVKCISVENGKNVVTCGKFTGHTKKLYAPRYGCGKCQITVPCSTGIPTKQLP